MNIMKHKSYSYHLTPRCVKTTIAGTDCVDLSNGILLVQGNEEVAKSAFSTPDPYLKAEEKIAFRGAPKTGGYFAIKNEAGLNS